MQEQTKIMVNLIRLSHMRMGNPYVYRLPIWVYTYGTGPYTYGQKYSYGTEHMHSRRFDSMVNGLGLRELYKSVLLL